MSKARDLADFVSDGSPLSDGAISVSEVSGAAPTASPTFTGDATFDTDTLFVNSTTDRVGVGTTTPNSRLEVSDDVNDAELKITATAANRAALLDLTGTIAGYNWISSDTNGTADWRIGGGTASGTLTFATGSSNTEAMRINSSGDLLLGSQSPVTGLRYFDIYNTGSTSTDGSIMRFITQEVGSTSTTTGSIFKRKNGEFRFANYDTDAAAYIGFDVGASERFRIGSSGQLGIGGANYGTSGQVLTSNGSSSAPSWQSVSFTTNVITTNTTATANNHYYLNGSAITVTLPASPSVGDEVRISEVAGNTDCVIGRNGSNIMSSGTDLTIDTGYTVIYLRYVDATIGWAFS